MPAPKQTKVKFPRAKADKIIKKVEKHIKPFVDRHLACGSYRRGAQMVGDIDFVIIPKEGVTLPQMLPPNDGINWVGDNKAQVIIDGEKVDFKVTTPDAWGATILYFTGPADFNIKYRWMAKKRGMKLNEYGLWDRTTDAYIAGASEEDIYDALKRPFRDPDQRKGWKAEGNQRCNAVMRHGSMTRRICSADAEYLGYCPVHSTCERCGTSLIQEGEFYSQDEEPDLSDGHSEGFCLGCWRDTGKYGAETFGSDSCQKCGALPNEDYWINECCNTPNCYNCGDECYAETNNMSRPINEEHVLNCTEHSCCMDYTSRGLHLLTKAKNWPLILDFMKSGGYADDYRGRPGSLQRWRNGPPEQVKILNSWEEWENINQGFENPEKEYITTNGKSGNNYGFNQWYYINFPCTVYRGSEKRGIDYETYLGMDDNAIKPFRSFSRNQGLKNVIAASPEMTEALNFGNFSLEPKSSMESHSSVPFSHNETTASELYSFDIQDYVVGFPRLSTVGRSGRALPVIFIAGGVYYDDAILLWEQDYYSREAETFGSENQWIVNNLTMLLTQRARTLKELIDDLGIRGITVESNLVRNSTFVRVGKHVPAVYGLKGHDYNVRHPYNAISPSAGRKQHLKTMFEKLDPREKDWDDDVTWNQKSDEPDWTDKVEWDAEYEVISLQDMDDFLKKRRFKPVDMYYRRKPVKEWVYERKLPAHANHFIRVYTSINRYGGKTDQSRDVGKDAIRVQVIYRDNKGETLVSMPKRVNRVSTWKDNLDDRLTEIAQTLPTVTMDSRGEPMTLRKKKGSLFWGSRDYPTFKETRRYSAEQEDLSEGLLVEDQYNHIDDPESMQYIYDNFVQPNLLSLRQPPNDGVMFGHDFQQQIDHMMAEEKHGFLLSGKKKGDIWLMIPIYEDNSIFDISALSCDAMNGDLVMQDTRPLSDIFDARTGEDPFYYFKPINSSIWKALTEGRRKDAINYNTIGNSFAAETSFRSEEVMGDDYLINIMITEYLLKTTKNYDVHDIMKKAMTNIDLSTYQFIRGMSSQFAGDFDLVPQGSTLIPEDFINYAEVTTMEHWGNLMTRGVDNKRLIHLLRLIISDEFWFNPSYKEKYEQWLTRSAINYQNI